MPSDPVPVTRPALAVHPCRALCAWSPTPALRGDERVFACAGCGSQWVRSQQWTPVDADGSLPDEVRAERRAG